MLLRRPIQILGCGLSLVAMLALGGCPPDQQPPDEEIPLNTTDPTNGGASYVTSAVCDVCHFNVFQHYQLSGHNHILNQVIGRPPVYPREATRAGVPNPPAGFSWNDISFVIGGYTRKANFLDSQGFLLTDGTTGVNTQWNLTFSPSQTPAQFAPFEAGQTTPLPYRYECFRCHTTGPSPEGHQMGLPGIEGTWVQPNVQCEACHGPGSRHIANPPRDIYINPTAAFCGQCHSRQPNGPVQAANGFILHEQQYPEMRVSPHAALQCVTCHDAHTSPNYEVNAALVNVCQNCHPTYNMAAHAGKVYAFGDYTETLNCQSCHMPFATLAATPKIINGGRIGDIRTHIWRINPTAADFTAMFNNDGDALATGTAGQAAVTLDFVCLRCHHGQGNVFALTLQQAANIAAGIHAPNF